MTYFFNINLFKGAYFYNRVALQHNFTHIKNKKRTLNIALSIPFSQDFSTKVTLPKTLINR